MKRIKTKLHDRSGASIIIALVYLLICAFVGGTVLAAATANSGHIGERANSTQSYMAQRSAALIFKDELTPASGQITLTANTVITDTVVTQSSGSSTHTTDTKYVMSVPDGFKSEGLRRLIFDPAAKMYIDSVIGGTAVVELKNFTASDYSELFTSGQTCTVRASSEGDSLENVTVECKCADGTNGTNLYDLTFVFKDSGGNSVLEIYMKCEGVKTGTKVIVPDSKTEGGTLTTTITTTIPVEITWQEPVIRKGSAA